jgi:hypothetical protein
VLQRRPNTFAQTILSLSFFACDKAADHTFRLARYAGNKGGRVRQTKNESSGPRDLAWPALVALVADSLCCGQEKRMMREPEIQIGDSNSKSSNKFKLRRRL